MVGGNFESQIFFFQSSWRRYHTQFSDVIELSRRALYSSPLAQAAPRRLEQRYDLTVMIEDGVIKCHVAVVISHPRPLRALLQEDFHHVVVPIHGSMMKRRRPHEGRPHRPFRVHAQQYLGRITMTVPGSEMERTEFTMFQRR